MAQNLPATLFLTGQKAPEVAEVVTEITPQELSHLFTVEVDTSYVGIKDRINQCPNPFLLISVGLLDSERAWFPILYKQLWTIDPGLHVVSFCTGCSQMVSRVAATLIRDERILASVGDYRNLALILDVYSKHFFNLNLD